MFSMAPNVLNGSHRVHGDVLMAIRLYSQWIQVDVFNVSMLMLSMAHKWCSQWLKEYYLWLQCEGSSNMLKRLKLRGIRLNALMKG